MTKIEPTICRFCGREIFRTLDTWKTVNVDYERTELCDRRDDNDDEQLNLPHVPGRPPRRDWFESHANLVLLTDYLARYDHRASDVAYAVDKPWKYRNEFIEAQIEAES